MVPNIQNVEGRVEVPHFEKRGVSSAPFDTLLKDLSSAQSLVAWVHHDVEQARWSINISFSQSLKVLADSC